MRGRSGVRPGANPGRYVQSDPRPAPCGARPRSRRRADARLRDAEDHQDEEAAMKMHVKFTIVEGPAALQQIAAVVGFANSLGIPITMAPEEDAPKSSVQWTEEEFEILDKDQKAY